MKRILYGVGILIVCALLLASGFRTNTVSPTTTIVQIALNTVGMIASATRVSVIDAGDSLATVTALISGDAVFTGGTLNASSVMAGSNAFTTTATSDTVTIAGAANTDLYSITLTGAAAPSANDAVRVQATTTGFIVRRASSGTSGLTYNWVRLKP